MNSNNSSQVSNITKREIVGDINQIANEMSGEVIKALLVDIEDLNILKRDFQTVVESTALRLMTHIDKSEERIEIYEDAIPGFTLMAIKKNYGRISNDTSENEKKIDDKIGEETLYAASSVIENFMKRTNNSIISIEHKSILLLLFCVSDTKKHLKELGIWF